MLSGCVGDAFWMFTGCFRGCFLDVLGNVFWMFWEMCSGCFGRCVLDVFWMFWECFLRDKMVVNTIVQQNK